MVAVMMEKYNLDIQSGVDRVGDICIKAMTEYLDAKSKFPSFGVKIDRQLEGYFHVVQSWMSGCLEWSFVTPRYLGPKRKHIRQSRWVDLTDIPQRSANRA